MLICFILGIFVGGGVVSSWPVGRSIMVHKIKPEKDFIDVIVDGGLVHVEDQREQLR